MQEVTEFNSVTFFFLAHGPIEYKQFKNLSFKHK